MGHGIVMFLLWHKQTLALPSGFCGETAIEAAERDLMRRALAILSWLTARNLSRDQAGGKDHLMMNILRIPDHQLLLHVKVRTA